MKKEYAIRVVQTHTLEGEEQHEGGAIALSFLDSLRYAGCLQLHETDPNGLTSVCFDIPCPFPRDLDTKKWSEHNAERMQSFGFNAVSAPACPRDTSGEVAKEALASANTPAVSSLIDAARQLLDWATRECMPQGSKGDAPWGYLESALARISDNPPSIQERDKLAMLFAKHGCRGYWKEEYATLPLGSLIALLRAKKVPALEKVAAALASPTALTPEERLKETYDRR